MNKKIRLSLFAGLLSAVGLFLLPTDLYSSYNIKVYREQGGARMVVGSGGSLDVASGGELDVESGGALKIAGTAVTSSAAELNVMDGVTATAAELNQAAAAAQLTEGLTFKRLAKVVYDVATDLGTIAAHPLGVSLPANAIITRSWLEIITQFTDAGSGTVAIHCEDANNIKTATDITGSAAGALIEGESTGAASAFKTAIAAPCEITATVATASQTAGKLNIFVEYVVGQ